MRASSVAPVAVLFAGLLASGCAVVRLKPYLPDALERDVRALIAGDRVHSWPAEHETRLP